MNNTIYESCWLVTWKENGIIFNQTCNTLRAARSMVKNLQNDPDFYEIDLVELVPEGVKTLDMSQGDFDEGWAICDIIDLADDSCDWCNNPMPPNEAGHCCSNCFMGMEARGRTN